MIFLDKVVIIVLFFVLQIPLIIAAVLRMIAEKKLKMHGIVAEGVVIHTKSKHYVNISYEVNGNKYTKKYAPKVGCNLSEGDTVEISYLISNPKYSFPHTYQLHTLSIAYIAFAIVFMLFADFMIIVGLFVTKALFNLCFSVVIGIAIMGAALINLISELNYTNATNATKVVNGKIISHSKFGTEDIFVAEYILNGKKNCTREMRVSIKDNNNKLKKGDEVEVRYISDKPYLAIISTDLYTLKKARLLFIFSCCLALAIIIFNILRFNIVH